MRGWLHMNGKRMRDSILAWLPRFSYWQDQEISEVVRQKIGHGRLLHAHRQSHLIAVNEGFGGRGFLMCRSCGYVDPVEGTEYPSGMLHLECCTGFLADV